MTDMISKDLVLRRDRLGRVRTPMDRQEEILAEFHRSGMSGRAFARHYGINYQTFASWVAKHRKLEEKNQGPGINLVEAVIEAGGERPIASGQCVQVHLPGGASVGISNQQQAGLVASLIRQLTLGPC